MIILKLIMLLNVNIIFIYGTNFLYSFKYSINIGG